MEPEKYSLSLTYLGDIEHGAWRVRQKVSLQAYCSH